MVHRTVSGDRDQMIFIMHVGTCLKERACIHRAQKTHSVPDPPPFFPNHPMFFKSLVKASIVALLSASFTLAVPTKDLPFAGHKVIRFDVETSDARDLLSSYVYVKKRVQGMLLCF